jgi:hypothetical protein
MLMDAVLSASAVRNEALPSIVIITKGGSVRRCSSHWYTEAGQLCQVFTM